MRVSPARSSVPIDIDSFGAIARPKNARLQGDLALAEAYDAMVATLPQVRTSQERLVQRTTNTS
jgi:hypothetical protein